MRVGRVPDSVLYPGAEWTVLGEDLDVAGVWAIDGAVQFMLEMWDIDYIPIESFSFKERQRTVEALLRGK